MTPKEQAAMQQALEALETDEQWGFVNKKVLERRLPAITALREALAEQAEQEPVAWMDLHKELGKLRWMGGDEGWDNAINAVRDRLIELSATVRTKDLTDSELDALVDSACDSQMPMDMFARAVIAKFKEVNNL